MPGNGGSKAQGRSIAAEADRMAARLQSPVALRFYVVHFAGQLSAFDAGILRAQAAFVERCLTWLARDGAAHTVFVVGHSMGAHDMTAHS
jgi:PGAP1-like protein